MSSFDIIKKDFETELKQFEQKFRLAMKSSVPLLDTVMTYIVKRKGKQLRPLFVFATANLHGGITEATYRGASLVELLHTATLVHDDVVDDSDERRGMFSINAIWKNKIAVLVGDYLLAKGLLLSVDNNDFGLLKIVSNAVREMSEGELLQIEKARRMDITEDIYYDIIRKKTASLIASCCAVGAASAGANEEEINNMISFGEKIGMAFQIKDDILDYSEADIGKPRGIDIKERKMTLPLIYTLNNCTSSEKQEIINTVKKHNTSTKHVKKVFDYVKHYKGIEYANTQMERLIDEAMELMIPYKSHESYKHINILVELVIKRDR